MSQKHVHSLVRRAAETCLTSTNLVVISANSMIGVVNESHMGLNVCDFFFLVTLTVRFLTKVPSELLK